MNIEILKCYKTVFKVKELKKNQGFFIIGFAFILYLITLFIFIFKSYSDLKKEIKNIIWALKFNYIQMKNHQVIKNQYLNKVNEITDLVTLDEKSKKNQKKTYFSKKEKKKMIKNKNKTKNNSKLILLNDKENNAKKLANLNKERFDKNNLLTNKILEIKEFELDSLDYQEALKIDHRNYWQYYCHLLKYNHSISFSFSFHNDYNIQIIKKFLFFFSFSLDFTINALFFTDKTIHKIYQDKGEFNFLFNINRKIY